MSPRRPARSANLPPPAPNNHLFSPHSLLSGFNNGCLAVNSLAENYETFVRHVGKVLVAQKQGQILSRVSGHHNAHANQVIEYIGRQLTASSVSSEEVARVLSSCTILSEDAVQGFVAVFERLTQATVETKPTTHVCLRSS
jgi:hypothetical protein